MLCLISYYDTRVTSQAAAMDVTKARAECHTLTKRIRKFDDVRQICLADVVLTEPNENRWPSEVAIILETELWNIFFPALKYYCR